MLSCIWFELFTKISDGLFVDKMIDTKPELRNVINFLTKEGSGPKGRIVALYGEDAPSYFRTEDIV